MRGRGAKAGAKIVSKAKEKKAVAKKAAAQSKGGIQLMMDGISKAEKTASPSTQPATRVVAIGISTGGPKLASVTGDYFDDYSDPSGSHSRDHVYELMSCHLFVKRFSACRVTELYLRDGFGNPWAGPGLVMKYSPGSW